MPTDISMNSTNLEIESSGRTLVQSDGEVRVDASQHTLIVAGQNMDIGAPNMIVSGDVIRFDNTSIASNSERVTLNASKRVVLDAPQTKIEGGKLNIASEPVITQNTTMLANLHVQKDLTSCQGDLVMQRGDIHVKKGEIYLGAGADIMIQDGANGQYVSLRGLLNM